MFIQDDYFYAFELVKSCDLLNSVELQDNMIVSITAAIVGAFSAYLFNFFHWRKETKLIKKNELLKSAYNHILEMENISIDYWTVDTASANKNVITKQEIKIKCLIRILIKYPRLFPNSFDKKDFENMVDDLYELCTGGDFESSKRKKCDKTALNISLLCAEIRLNLTKIIFNT